MPASRAPRAFAPAALLLLLCCARPARSLPALPRLSNLTVFHVNAIDAAAVCNDGSPGAYYYAPSSSAAGASQWLLYLGGRDWCYDYTSCSERRRYSPSLMSSQAWPSSLALGGLFSPLSKNPLAGANKVFLGYCSSDAWTGDIGASTATFDFAFRGQRILKAVLSALATQHGLGGSAVRQDRVLLAGGAGGGRGALLSLDSVSHWLSGSTTTHRVSVQGLFDAALWVPLSPLGNALASATLASQVQRAIGLFNATALQSTACLAAYPVSTEQWQCFFPSTRLPYVRTPYLLAQPQFDKPQLLWDLSGALPPYDTAQSAFAESFASAVAAASAAAVASPSSSNGLFSPACFKGPVTLSPQLWGVRAGGSSTTAPSPPAPTSLGDLLRLWFVQNVTGLSVSVRDSCAGFACGGTCRSNAGHARSSPRPVRAPEGAMAGAPGSSDAAAASLGVTARTMGQHGGTTKRGTAAALLFLFAVAAAVAALLYALLPRAGISGGRGAAEGTPLRPSEVPEQKDGIRDALAQWAWQEADRRKRNGAMSRSQIAARFNDGL